MSIRASKLELTAHHNQLLWFCSNGQPLEMSQLAQTGRSGLIRETSEPRRGGTENQTCRINGEARRVPLNERACRFALNRFEIDYHSISKSTSVIRDGAAPEARNELAQTGRSGLIRETSEPRRGGTENQTCRINGEARRVPLNERACRFALNRFEIDYHSIGKSTSVIRDGAAPEARNELAQIG